MQLGKSDGNRRVESAEKNLAVPANSVDKEVGEQAATATATATATEVRRVQPRRTCMLHDWEAIDAAHRKARAAEKAVAKAVAKAAARAEARADTAARAETAALAETAATPFKYYKTAQEKFKCDDFEGCIEDCDAARRIQSRHSQIRMFIWSLREAAYYFQGMKQHLENAKILLENAKIKKKIRKISEKKKKKKKF